MVGGEQVNQLDEETRQQLETSQVPDELIAQFEAVEEQDQGIITVLYEHITAFWVFFKCRNRWLYVNRPVGMGTLSVHDQLDWNAAERIMQRLPEVRSMTGIELDELYEQVEIMESEALTVFAKEFKRLISK